MMMRKAASMGLRDLVYRLYERRLQAALSPDAIPRHVGVMCDGNRRWAKSAGFRDVSSGHRKGADKIFELLDWCRESGVEVVTLWLLSTDNLTRSSAELVPLLTSSNPADLAHRRFPSHITPTCRGMASGDRAALSLRS